MRELRGETSNSDQAHGAHWSPCQGRSAFHSWPAWLLLCVASCSGHAVDNEHQARKVEDAGMRKAAADDGSTKTATENSVPSEAGVGRAPQSTASSQQDATAQEDRAQNTSSTVVIRPDQVINAEASSSVDTNGDSPASSSSPEPAMGKDASVTEPPQPEPPQPEAAAPEPDGVTGNEFDASTPNPVTPNPGLIGGSCAVDSDCASGLRCLSSDSNEFFGGGPANGLCTMDCATDLACQQYDPGTLCISIDSNPSICIQTCTPGVPPTGETKCQNRADVACSTIDEAISPPTLCTPLCRSDDDCHGRNCDLSSGVCTDQPTPQGNPIGSDCSPDDPSTCATGLCVEFSTGFAQCTAFCTVGTIGCGNDSFQPEDPAAPMCLNVFAGVVGDLGLCSPRCDCDADCTHPGALCWTGPFGDNPDGVNVFGTRGICVDNAFEPQPGDNFPTPCE